MDKIKALEFLVKMYDEDDSAPDTEAEWFEQKSNLLDTFISIIRDEKNEFTKEELEKLY
jgi:hypothetical protein